MDVRGDQARPAQSELRVIPDEGFLAGLAHQLRQQVGELLALELGLGQALGALALRAGHRILAHDRRGGLEILALGDEIRLAAKGGQYGCSAIGRGPCNYQAFGSLPLSAFGHRGQALAAEYLDGFVDIAAGFVQGGLAVHHALAGHLSEFHYVGG